jgi:hypothetical protein
MATRARVRRQSLGRHHQRPRRGGHFVLHATRCPMRTRHRSHRVADRLRHRRSAVEGVISQMKTDGHLPRCHLKGRTGDAANATLTAVAYCPVEMNVGSDILTFTKQRSTSFR